MAIVECRPAIGGSNPKSLLFSMQGMCSSVRGFLLPLPHRSGACPWTIRCAFGGTRPFSLLLPDGKRANIPSNASPTLPRCPTPSTQNDYATCWARHFSSQIPTAQRFGDVVETRSTRETPIKNKNHSLCIREQTTRKTVSRWNKIIIVDVQIAEWQHGKEFVTEK